MIKKKSIQELIIIAAEIAVIAAKNKLLKQPGIYSCLRAKFHRNILNRILSHIVVFKEICTSCNLEKSVCRENDRCVYGRHIKRYPGISEICVYIKCECVNNCNCWYCGDGPYTGSCYAYENCMCNENQCRHSGHWYLDYPDIRKDIIPGIFNNRFITTKGNKRLQRTVNRLLSMK